MASLDRKLGTPPATRRRARLTQAQWRQLEARLSTEERRALEMLREQWMRAAERVDSDINAEDRGSYEDRAAAAADAEADFQAFVRALRRVHGT